MHLPHECILLHPEKKSATNTLKKKPPPKKLTFAKAAIASMEAGDRKESKAGSENEKLPLLPQWINPDCWRWYLMEKRISKMMITIIIFIIVLGMIGGEFFTSLVGVIYDGTQYVNKTWGWGKVFCRMMTSLAFFWTCKHHKHPQSRKSSPRCYRRSTHRSQKMTARPASTVAWKTLQKGGRLRMALCCFTSLPLIINAKASLLVNAFPEGVDFDTDLFPIAIDSGSTFCLSDKRSDFDGDLTKVNVKIQGILESKY
jgi:hypothetical protein